MNLHHDHVIVESVGGWHCQTCADQAATEAALRNEITRLNEEIARLSRDNIAQLEKVGGAYFNTIACCGER